MYKDPYHRLASALDKLPNGFPRTESGVEIELLRRIFKPEEAELASHLTRDMESISEIAHRANLEEDEVERRLSSLAQRGLLRSAVKDGKPRYRLVPWIVGILETQVDTMDHSLAHLVEDYIHEDGFVERIMKPHPYIHRVIPAQSATKSEWILPYDDVKKVIESSKTFSVYDCICRKQKDLIGARKCDFPLDNCMRFSKIERPPNKHDISKEEALALLDETEKIGLVHTVSNVMEGLTYMCNCCICCCGILQNSSAVSNYFSTIEPESCIGCDLCEQRCQVKAISLKDNVAAVDLEKCIGCGLCVTGCPVGAARLQLKPEDKRVDPPKDLRVWEDQRLQNRGLL
jgi:NAD-dependent dihydropyrimidine dehydrogenase PreA subunit/DNA-binding transcriptional ArsR family regulator